MPTFYLDRRQVEIGNEERTSHIFSRFANWRWNLCRMELFTNECKSTNSL